MSFEKYLPYSTIKTLFMKKTQSGSIVQVLLLNLAFSFLLFAGPASAQAKNPNPEDSLKITGFSFFDRIAGQWNGPVFSSTPAGSSESWHVDFRPVAAGQVSQYTSIDTSALNYTSFFVVKRDRQLRIAMRTEGVFNNKGCVTYEVMDSVNEATGFYRFSDFVSGTRRAYTTFQFKDSSYTMEVYTTKFNKVNPLQLHSRYEARLGSRTAAAEAVEYFGYPRPVMVKDFTEAFRGMTESIYYTFENDPYPSSPQPYTGSLTVTTEVEKKLKVRPSDELYILLTTESLFSGIKYLPENLKYKSRYVFLPLNKKTYTLTNVHPGTYYLYAFLDVNGDRKHLSGDYMSSDPDLVVTVNPLIRSEARVKIDFVIP